MASVFPHANTMFPLHNHYTPKIAQLATCRTKSCSSEKSLCINKAAARLPVFRRVLSCRRYTSGSAQLICHGWKSTSGASQHLRYCTVLCDVNTSGRCIISQLSRCVCIAQTTYQEPYLGTCSFHHGKLTGTEQHHLRSSANRLIP